MADGPKASGEAGEEAQRLRTGVVREARVGARRARGTPPGSARTLAELRSHLWPLGSPLVWGVRGGRPSKRRKPVWAADAGLCQAFEGGPRVQANHPQMSALMPCGPGAAAAASAARRGAPGSPEPAAPAPAPAACTGPAGAAEPGGCLCSRPARAPLPVTQQ